MELGVVERRLRCDLEDRLRLLRGARSSITSAPLDVGRGLGRGRSTSSDSTARIASASATMSRSSGREVVLGRDLGLVVGGAVARGVVGGEGRSSVVEEEDELRGEVVEPEDERGHEDDGDQHDDRRVDDLRRVGQATLRISARTSDRNSRGPVRSFFWGAACGREPRSGAFGGRRPASASGAWSGGSCSCGHARVWSMSAGCW